MNNPLLVRGFERLGDLFRNRQRLVEWYCSSRDPIGKRGPFDQFHDQAAHGPRLLESIHVGDVGMIQRREGLRFALEARQTFGVLRERVWYHLDCDVATQARITRAIHLAHSARANGREDLICAKTGAVGQRHP
jgi:hypothetical protein